MAILFMNMLSQAIDIMGWQFGRQLKVLVRKHQRSKRGVKPVVGGGGEDTDQACGSF